MEKPCVSCGAQFEITSEDLEFYKKISPVFNGVTYPITPPTHCPDCRRQRRMVWKNERSIYPRPCDGCGKQYVSIHAPLSSFPIYCNACFWSDSFDARVYGREFDFSRPFFEQFKELRDRVPQIAIMNDNNVGSENCEYSQDLAFSKNCYFVSGTWRTKDSYYCQSSDHSSSLCECTYVAKSELVYETVDSRNLYNSVYLQDSENCADCMFGLDLRGCKNCFFCFGLRQREYCIFNEQYSKEDYEKKIAEFDIGSNENFKRLRKEFDKWVLQFPRKCMVLQNCENCTGSQLFDCKNTYGFFIYEAENCRYFNRGDRPLTSQDIIESGNCELCYEGVVTDDAYMTLSTIWCWKSKNTLYSDNCHSCEHVFGCISLKREKYCILNKQYTKDEYETLVPRIIEHMKKYGEFGEFFPIEICPYGYNETIVVDYFPMTKEQVLAKGWNWREIGKPLTPATCEIPDHIRDVPEDFSKEILVCEGCDKNYKIVAQELGFYKKVGVPIPHHCHMCRYRKRLRRRTADKLYDRNCMKCNSDIQTPYESSRPEIVYCEKCYLETVY